VAPTAPPFFLFLAVLFYLYWAAAEYRTLRLSVLLFANCFFLARFGLWYLVLIPAAGSLDFAAGLALERLKTLLLRRVILAGSVALNLGLLLTARYAGAPASGGDLSVWRLALPLGLSFYAFQALTYTIDVYRREIKAESSLLSHLAAVSLLPTPLAGPISRVGDLLPQLARTPQLSQEQAGRGFFLICLGLVKKLIVADYLADNLVNRVFDLPGLYSGFETAFAIAGYAFQLYYDFSGYTDIALGVALLFGLKLPINFDLPYASLNLPEFWRRWHISFSQWLRDYLYFSLPGLRSKQKLFTYANLVITFLLGGLWHGATWNFAIWGLLHGMGLAITRAWQTWRGQRPQGGNVWLKAACGIATFHFVCLTWVFFRAADLDGANAVLGRVFSFTFAAGNLNGGILLVMALAVAGHFIPYRWLERPADVFVRAPFYAQAAAMLAVVIALQFLTGKGAAPFVYSRF